jgi:hypothetical protein
MGKHIIDLGDDEFIEVPEKIKYQILMDHYQASYHWIFGFAGLAIGFLIGIIAKM